MGELGGKKVFDMLARLAEMEPELTEMLESRQRPAHEYE